LVEYSLAMETEASEAIAGDGGTEEDRSSAALAGNSNHSTEEESQQEHEQEHDPSGSSISLVPRKFLCNAPRPDQWESYGDAVLTHLGKKKAGGVLAQAVAKIRSLHSISPKAGPGRKSNAVHALLFYEYLLDRTGRDGGEEEGGGGGGDDDDDDSNGDDDASEDGVGPERKFPPNKEVDDPLAAFTDEEFIAHHKHVCEVCEDTPSKEPLLLCSTCRLAFHIPCSRPVLEGGLPPPDDGMRWRCSYCVLATEPKNTKPRRVSAAAVRLMARCVKMLWVMPRLGRAVVCHLSHTLYCFSLEYEISISAIEGVLLFWRRVEQA
jgi:PHD-finger